MSTATMAPPKGGKTKKKTADHRPAKSEEETPVVKAGAPEFAEIAEKIRRKFTQLSRHDLTVYFEVAELLREAVRKDPTGGKKALNAIAAVCGCSYSRLVMMRRVADTWANLEEMTAYKRPSGEALPMYAFERTCELEPLKREEILQWCCTVAELTRKSLEVRISRKKDGRSGRSGRKVVDFKDPRAGLADLRKRTSAFVRVMPVWTSSVLEKLEHLEVRDSKKYSAEDLATADETMANLQTICDEAPKLLAKLKHASAQLRMVVPTPPKTVPVPAKTSAKPSAKAVGKGDSEEVWGEPKPEESSAPRTHHGKPGRRPKKKAARKK